MVAALPEWEHNELPLREQLQGSKLRLSIRRYEPVGVVAAITPYNFPFITNVWKVMPALATGCTIVLRPSPLTPLSALVFGEAADEAGLPPGVLNVVAEGGAEGGAAAVEPSGRRPRELHRFGRGRAHDRDAGRPDPEACGARARGQERAAAPPRRARRRACGRGGAGGDGVHRARRPGLRVADADARAPRHEGRGARRSGRGRRAHATGRSPRAVDHGRTAHHRRASNARRSPGRGRPRGRRATRRRRSSSRGSRPWLVLLADRRRHRRQRQPARAARGVRTRDHRAGLRRRRRSGRDRQRQRVRPVGRCVHRRPRPRPVDRGADPVRHGAGEHVGRDLVHPDGWVQAERHRARARGRRACGSSRS